MTENCLRLLSFSISYLDKYQAQTDNQILLLRLFHKELIILEKESLDFGKR